MFDVIMETIDLDLPAFMGTLFSYAANPGLIIPAVLLMVYVCSRDGDLVIVFWKMTIAAFIFNDPTIKIFLLFECETTEKPLTKYLKNLFVSTV